MQAFKLLKWITTLIGDFKLIVDETKTYLLADKSFNFLVANVQKKQNQPLN